MRLFGKKKYTVVSSLGRTKDVLAFASRHAINDSDAEVRAIGSLYENEPLVKIEFRSREEKNSIFNSFLNEFEGSRVRRATMFC